MKETAGDRWVKARGYTHPVTCGCDLCSDYFQDKISLSHRIVKKEEKK